MMLFDVTFFLEVISPPATITFTLSFFNKSDNDLDNAILSDLPSTITSIGRQCFFQCSQLVTFICRNTTPPTLDSGVFESTNSALSIYVPDESVDAYKTATNWVNYASIIKPLSEYVES